LESFYLVVTKLLLFGVYLQDSANRKREIKMNKIPGSIVTLIVGVVVTASGFWVSQNHHLLPEQASVQAPLVDNFFSTMIGIATVLFLIVQGAILLFTIKYRRRKGDDTDGVPIEGNFALEIVWTSIPAIIVIWLGIYSVQVYEDMGGLSVGHGSQHHSSQMMASTQPVADFGLGSSQLEAAKPADLLVNVTGMQYAWLFNYPDRNITTGDLHVPVGKDIQINLTAQDVIHSFWIPPFRIKQDVMPGINSQLRFVATKTGTFPIVCAELCGSYHGGMRSQIVVQTQEEFDRWLSET
jgi:cytochrome c oxidase subunit II